MQRRDALLIRVGCVQLAAVKQLLDGANLAQTRQLHQVLLDGQAGLRVAQGHVVEFMLRGVVGGACGHLGGPHWGGGGRASVLQRDRKGA